MAARLVRGGSACPRGYGGPSMTGEALRRELAPRLIFVTQLPSSDYRPPGTLPDGQHRDTVTSLQSSPQLLCDSRCRNVPVIAVIGGCLRRNLPACRWCLSLNTTGGTVIPGCGQSLRTRNDSITIQARYYMPVFGLSAEATRDPASPSAITAEISPLIMGTPRPVTRS